MSFLLGVYRQEQCDLQRVTRFSRVAGPAASTVAFSKMPPFATSKG
jgi:hypothetical protein